MAMNLEELISELQLWQDAGYTLNVGVRHGGVVRPVVDTSVRMAQDAKDDKTERICVVLELEDLRDV